MHLKSTTPPERNKIAQAASGPSNSPAKELTTFKESVSVINITSLTILSASLPRSQTDGFRIGPRSQGMRRGEMRTNDNHPKRPHDPNQLAKSLIDIATGQLKAENEQR